jgi:hypothetical protein
MEDGVGVESLASLASRWNELQMTGAAEDLEEMHRIEKAVAQVPARNMGEIGFKLSLLASGEDSEERRALYDSVVRDMCAHSVYSGAHVVAGITLLSSAMLLMLLYGRPHNR